MKHSRNIRRRGFTLVEIIVSLGIFAVVATVALGALVKIIGANKKAQTIQATVTNINFALDAMSREIRVGRNYYCVSGPGSSFTRTTLDQEYTSATKCPAGVSNNSNGTIVAFLSSKIDRITTPNSPCNLIYAYLFEYNSSSNTYTLKKAEQPSCGSNAYTFESILDPNVTLTGYYVRVVAADANSFPRATLRISGYAGVLEKEKTFFDVQTTLSARVQ
jgi:prepilin-type N-terminal cleavage/methylation domain-containing protein